MSRRGSADGQGQTEEIRRRRITIAQIAIELGHMQENLEKICSVIERHRKSDIIVFPELVVHGHAFGTLTPEEIREGISRTPSLKAVEKAARQIGARVLLGSMEEREEGRFVNVAVYIGSKVTQRYEKTHVHWSECFTPGEELRVFDTGLERIGPLICFDAAFPESSRVLTLLGAKIIAVLAAVPEGFDRDVMDRRMSAIAVMNQVFVLYANRGGDSFSGRSGVWNPRGERIAHVGTGEEFLEVDLDLNEVDYWRQEEPLLPHRRQELYHRIVEDGPHASSGRAIKGRFPAPSLSGKESGS